MNNENEDHTHECKDCGWKGIDGQLLCAGKNKEKIPISQKTELYLCPDCESVNVFEIGGGAVNETCQWQNDCDDTYSTECRNNFFFVDENGLKENNFKFCPFCGKEIKEIK